MAAFNEPSRARTRRRGCFARVGATWTADVSAQTARRWPLRLQETARRGELTDMVTYATVRRRSKGTRGRARARSRGACDDTLDDAHRARRPRVLSAAARVVRETNRTTAYSKGEGRGDGRERASHGRAGVSSPRRARAAWGRRSEARAQTRRRARREGNTWGDGTVERVTPHAECARVHARWRREAAAVVGLLAREPGRASRDAT
jgi:hypothetical protein